jgi:hypothetical protein
MGNRQSNGIELTMRPEGNPLEYVNGLRWILEMYCTGSIKDYRWSYDLAAPSAQHLIDALKSEATGSNVDVSADAPTGGLGASPPASGVRQEAAAAGEASMEFAALPKHRRQAKKANGESLSDIMRHQSRPPLIPAACALALLPKTSRRLAATPLRHIMDSESSPIAEIYAVCEECRQHALHISTGELTITLRCCLPSLRIHNANQLCMIWCSWEGV